MEPEVHRSVLVEEVLHYLAPRADGIYVDGTLGFGGHAERILGQCGPNGLVIGLDRDREALAIARERLLPFGERSRCLCRNFFEVGDVLRQLGIDRVDGLFLDLGVSSYQLDKSGRGFSFQRDEPLDMRMDDSQGPTAADLLASLSEQELADIFFYYGEERWARRIAARVIAARRLGAVKTTQELVDIVTQAIPRRFYPKNIHVATKTFQGLRIAVNNELENLHKALEVGADVLKPGARFCVISFHSLEDRLVKRAWQGNPLFEIITKKPVRPGEEEIGLNPRARSAKLRVGQRI